MCPSEPTIDALRDDAVATLGRDRDPAALQQHAHNLGQLVRAMVIHGKQRNDPVRSVPALLGDRWSSLILHLLSGGILRHTELRKLICKVSSEGDISQRMLTLKLRVLERDGLVLRVLTDNTPPRVEYRLTVLGEGAYQCYLAVLRWSEGATPVIRAARMTYDARHDDGAKLNQRTDRDI